MKIEWLKRDEICNTRIEVELEVEKMIREQIRLREINAIEANIIVDQIKEAYLKVFIKIVVNSKKLIIAGCNGNQNLIILMKIVF